VELYSLRIAAGAPKHTYWKPGKWLYWNVPNYDSHGPAFEGLEQTDSPEGADFYPSYAQAKKKADDHMKAYGTRIDIVKWQAEFNGY